MIYIIVYDINLFSFHLCVYNSLHILSIIIELSFFLIESKNCLLFTYCKVVHLFQIIKIVNFNIIIILLYCKLIFY